MKVVRIVSELDFGGVEQVVALSIPSLVKINGIEVKVIVLGKGGRISDKLTKEGHQVVILNQTVKIPNLILVWKLKKKIQKELPDLIHCQGAEANFHGIWAAKLAEVKTILGEEIGLPNHHSYWKWIFKWVYKKANRVIAISEAVKNRMVELGEVSPVKVRVIYNPVCLKGIGKREQGKGNREQGLEIHDSVGLRFLEEEKGKDVPFVFVTTCRLVTIKNLDRLIQAFEGLVKGNPDRQLYLRIVGEGPEKRNLELLIKNLKLDSQVEFLGFQSNVWPYLLDADAFILPSLREGSSVSLAEAMTAGLPSIVTQVGGAGELLGDSQSGILIDPLNVESIQSAMQQILDLSPEVRQAMGERAKKEAQRFSVENYIASLLKIYQGL